MPFPPNFAGIEPIPNESLGALKTERVSSNHERIGGAQLLERETLHMKRDASDYNRRAGGAITVNGIHINGH